MGKIDIGITANNAGFKKAADETIDYMHRMSSEAKASGSEVSGMFKEVVKQTAAFAGLSLGAAGLRTFAASIVNVRKEMQSLSTSFKVLLGDEDRAAAMFGELKEFAATTPLMLKDLASGAQTMLGFNIEAEKVVPTLRAIGDISMGDAQKFQSLTLAFSQMSATGKLMGQDLLQMINAGFNPLTEISRKTGKSIAVLKDEMSAGAISAEMVADAFMSATAEGGKFHGMLEKQGQGLNGQINQLQGALDDMFNELGQKSEGVISAAIGDVTTLVQNYEKVAATITPLITTYGAYKAATIAVVAAERLHATSLGLVTKAQALFNAVMTANPVVAVATAVGALVGICIALSMETERLTKAQRELNEEQAKYEEQEKKRKKDVEDLVELVKDETKSDLERKTALDKLVQAYPDLFRQYDTETIKLADLLTLKQQINEEDRKRASQKLDDDIEAQQGKLAAAKAKALGYGRNDSYGNYLYRNVSTQQEKLDLMLEKKGKEVAEQFTTLMDSATDAQLDLYIAELKKRGKNAVGGTLVKMKLPTDLKGNLSDLVNLSGDTINSLIGLAEEEKNRRNAPVSTEVQNKEYWEKKKKEAENTLNALSDIEAKSAKGEAIKKQIEEYDKRLMAFNTGKNKDASREAESQQRIMDLEAQQARERERRVRDQELAIANARVAGMEEGSEKVLANADAEFEEELERIKRQQEDLIAQREKDAREMWEAQNKVEGATWTSSGAQKAFFDNGGGELTEEDKKYFDALRDAARNKILNVDDLLEKYQDFSAKKAAIDERYAADRERINQRIKANDEKLAGLGDTEDDKKIRTKIEKEQKALRSSLAQSTVEEAKDRMSVAMEELKADPAFLQAFEDLESVSAKTLDNLYNRLVALKPQLEGLDPKNMKVILDLMNNIQNTKIKKDPFKEYKKALQELREAENSGDEDAIIKARKKVERAYASIRESVDELAESINNLGNVIGGEAGEILSLIGDVMLFTTSSIKGMQSAAEASSRAIQMVERASVILAIISAAIQIFQKLNEVLNKFSSAAKHDELVKKQQDINNLADAVNSYRLEVLKATQAEDDWFGADGLGNLNDLAEQNAVAYENYFEKLNQIQVKYRDKSKNDNNWTNLLGVLGIGTPTYWTSLSGMLDAYGNDSSYTSAVNNLRIETQKRKKSFMGIGGRNQKTEDLRSWAKDQFGEDLFDMNGFVNIQLAETIIDSYGDKLQGETKDTLEALIELKKEYDQYQESLRDYVAELYEPLVDNFVDSMWEWFDSGVDALGKFKEKASDVFRDIVSDMMRTIILKNVVAGFQDQVTDLYKQYSEKQIDETSLLRGVAELTGGLMDRYENEMPVIQQMMSQMSDIMSTTGINLKGSGSTTSATVGGAAGITEDQGNEISGRLTAIQLQGETRIAQGYQSIGLSQTANMILGSILDLDAARNAYLSDIYERMGLMQQQMAAGLEAIKNNTKNL